MKEVKYADCANCIHRVFDEETYLKTNGTCLVDEKDIERFKKIVCKAFKAKEEVKMTSKAKAIEALGIIGNVETSDSGWTIAEDYSNQYEIIALQLSKPTLDDCIAVVEKMENKDKSYFYAIALDDVLTALKGLKVEK